jgi:hypothetical protein
MAEPLNEPIRKLQQAREQSRAQVEADVAGARDAYVPLLEAHEQAERDWLQAPGDEQLAKRAQDTFDALRAGRQTLRQALQGAMGRRDDLQRAAWTDAVTTNPPA